MRKFVHFDFLVQCTERLQFLKTMGDMIRLKDCKVFSGGLDRKNDADGKWSLFYEDEVIQVCCILIAALVLNCH